MPADRTSRFNRRQLEFIAIGGTIGAGLFLGMGQGIALAGPALLLAYALAGLMVFVIARCLGELALNVDPSQIFLSHTARYLGRRVAFVQGWSYWACAIIVSMAELTGGAALVHAWLPAIPTWLVALVELAILLAINRLGVRAFGETEFWMAFLKIATIAGFLLIGAAVLLGVPHVEGASVSNLWSDGGFFPHGAAGFFAALPIALFAFGGTELIGVASAEAEDPRRNIPRATNGLLARVVLFYLGSTFVVLALVPWKSLSPDGSPMVSVLSGVGIPAASAFLNVVLISAALSSCNSLLYASSRIARALSEMRAAPAALGHVSGRGVPDRALLLAGALTSSAILLNFLLPATLFQLLLGAGALTIVTNWCIILVVHLRYRSVRGRAEAPEFAAPWAPWSNYAVLLLAAAVIFIAAQQGGMRVAFGLFVVLWAGLALGSCFLRPERRERTLASPPSASGV